LRRAGYRVLERNRGTGCVGMILQEKPDLVLLDVFMPGVAGDTLVKLITRARVEQEIIVLLHSTLDEQRLRGKAEASGAHGYVTKTSDGATLLQTVRHWLRTKHVASVPAPTGPQAPLTSAHQSHTRRRLEPAASPSQERPVRTGLFGDEQRGSGAFPIDLPTVLLVDDDMLALSAFRRQLQGQPFHFEFALSGAQALRVLTSENPPSVIVCDLLMPQPNGCELLRRALDRDRAWGHRFVIVTGQSLQDARSQLDSRFTGAILRKPVEAEALGAAIRRAMANSLALGGVRKAR
jgi:CheY-like chemotaxis protein